jgi:hypothetical protein
MDKDTWTRAKAWVLWKTTFDLFNRIDKKQVLSNNQIRIIDELLNNF